MGEAMSVKVTARTSPKWKGSTSSVSCTITWQQANVKQPAMTTAIPSAGRKNAKARERIAAPASLLPLLQLDKFESSRVNGIYPGNAAVRPVYEVTF